MQEGADILGNALRDYLNGEEVLPIKVYSDIAEPDELAVSYFFREYDQMPEIEKVAIQNCKGKIADLGAGAGSHALALQNQGFDVTAYDISGGACAVMQKRGVKQVKKGDALHLGSTRYDTILMLMNGLGLVNNLEGLIFFLNHIKANLNPGGQILVDSSDITYMYYDEEGALNINLNAEYHGVVTYQMAYKKTKGSPFSWLFVEFPVLVDYAQQSGFECTLLLEGDNYNYLAKLTLAN